MIIYISNNTHIDTRLPGWFLSDDNNRPQYDNTSTNHDVTYMNVSVRPAADNAESDIDERWIITEFQVIKAVVLVIVLSVVLLSTGNLVLKSFATTSRNNKPM